MSRSLSVARAQLWRQRLVRFHASQASVAEFCRQEGVSQPSFYLWRKRLSSQGAARPRSSAPAGFRAVQVVAATNVSVQLPGGTQLMVPTTDLDSLRAVIETVARVDAARVEGERTC
jgi:putative transposase